MARKDSDPLPPSEPPAPEDDSNTPPQDEKEEGETDDTQEDSPNAADDTKDSTEDEPPPLPDEPLPISTTNAPPLPDEPLPTADTPDDGWQPVWDPQNQAYYFHNRFTGATQWQNPRIPDAPTAPAPVSLPLPSSSTAASTQDIHPAVRGGYNPAIHGDYDPNADYAIGATGAETIASEEVPVAVGIGGSGDGDGYAATAQFNRFTGRFQAPELTPANHNDENKSHRQMNAFFDVDAAANMHDGRSLKAERASKRLSKSEVKRFKERRREKKEEKRRAWLRD